MPAQTRIEEQHSDSTIAGWLHRPARTTEGALALTHGASGNCQAPLLLALAECFSAAGWMVLRYDLPYRQRRSAGPPSPATAAIDQRGIAAAAKWLREESGELPVLGGHSYGGRQTSMAVADDAEMAMALLLLSYPLHPPGKPEKLRVEHLPRIQVPGLFVHGTKDPFGSPQEMRESLAVLRAPWNLELLEAAGHALVERKEGSAAFAQAAERIRQALFDLLKKRL